MNEKEKEVYLHKHILICGDNINSLGIIRSLGEKGIRPIVIVVEEGHIPLVSKSKYVSKLIKTESFEESYEELLKFADPACKPFVYTTDDNHESMLDLHYNELKDGYYFFNAGEAGRVTKLMNKDVLCDLAKECGFRIPAKEAVKRGELPKKINYPVITKTLTPYSAGWKRDVGIYHGDEELAEAYKGMISEELLLQEYVEKKNEYEIHGFSINNGEQIYLTFYSLYYRFSATTFGSYKYYQLPDDLELMNRIKNMIKSVRYTGAFEVEFLVDKNDELVFLEINFRFPLSNYACTYGHVNIPYLWAKSMINGKIDESEITPLTKTFDAMNEASDIQEILSRRRTHVLKWISQYLHSECHFLYNSHDILPYLSFWYHKCFKKLKKKSKRNVS